jgi:hypothetical protein
VGFCAIFAPLKAKPYFNILSFYLFGTELPGVFHE